MRTCLRTPLLAVVLLALAAAGAASGSRSTVRTCPVPDSGSCAGKLVAGTYTTASFRPKLTFTVPAGWANYLDVAGLYLLQPPGSKPPGDTIAGAFIGLETSVAPEAFDCHSRLRGVSRTPGAIVSWMAKQSGLVVTNRRDVTLAGLRGIVVDVRPVHGAKGCVAMGATKPAVPLLVGVGQSSFDHEVAPGFAERHFLLAYRGGTLDVQLVDPSGGKNLPRYTAIVDTFHFSL